MDRASCVQRVCPTMDPMGSPSALTQLRGACDPVVVPQLRNLTCSLFLTCFLP